MSPESSSGDSRAMQRDVEPGITRSGSYARLELVTAHNVDYTQSQRIRLEESEKDEYAEKVLAKITILEAENAIELLDAAYEQIDENWLGDVDALPGNIYRIGAFGGFSYHETANVAVGIARRLGCIFIFFIQLLGPPGIFMSTVKSWGVAEQAEWHWENWHISLHDWEHIALTKLLAFFAIFCFVLNGLFVTIDEQRSWQTIDKMFRYLDANTEKFSFAGYNFLLLDGFSNCWVILWCCLDAFVVIGGSDSPKNVLFDSLGLLFLFNLDDIGGDLGFVDEDDWPGARLGWIRNEMVEPNFHRDGKRSSKFLEDHVPRTSKIVLAIYDCTVMILVVFAILLPFGSIVTPFMQMKP
eukprot:gnl/TRDRNA2_/TRDRNA2_153569_c0_seq3.p1 gnl/TRDRNA2_/TRDRNA2_153569_c0~~gnl/TRDRNA2_/TRDRNA2_153569_c0_seq3.p1  ORF type:complete len:355 (-),score=44.12 gnl/TRDRNA2_/TRDRNA2_153569_c0_seq3:291-1355(-)